MRTQNLLYMVVLYFTIILSCLQTSCIGSSFLSPGYSRVSKVGAGFQSRSNSTSYEGSFIPHGHNSEAVIDGTELFSRYSHLPNTHEELHTYKMNENMTNKEFRSRSGYLPSNARSELHPQINHRVRPSKYHQRYRPQLKPLRTQISRMQPPIERNPFRFPELNRPYKPVVRVKDRKYDVLSDYDYSSVPSDLHHEHPGMEIFPKPQKEDSSVDFESHSHPYEESHKADEPQEPPKDEHSHNFPNYFDYIPDTLKSPPKKDKGSKEDFPKFLDYHPYPPKEPPTLDKQPKPQKEDTPHNFPNTFEYHHHPSPPKELPNIEKPPKPQKEFSYDFPKYLEYHVEPPKDTTKIEHEEHSHDFETYLDHHPEHHEEPTTTTEKIKEQTGYLFSFYGIGYKLFYVPLYAGIIFVSFVLYLILRSQTRHKVLVPYDFITNPQKRTARAALDDITLNVMKALETENINWKLKY